MRSNRENDVERPENFKIEYGNYEVIYTYIGDDFEKKEMPP